MPRQESGRDEYTQKAFEMIPKIKQPKSLYIAAAKECRQLNWQNDLMEKSLA